MTHDSTKTQDSILALATNCAVAIDAVLFFHIIMSSQSVGC